MQVGLLSDLHANLPATEAVLANVPDVDALLCAGDVVGYYPWPGDCVAAVRDREVPTVSGNHDRMVTGESNFRANRLARAGVEYAREHLEADDLDWLRGLPTELTALDGRVRVVHGHPADPDRYTYPRDFGPGLLGEEEVLVMGHTHVQHAETYEAGVVVNPGSVGQPRDGDPRAAYAVLDLSDPDRPAVDLRRVEYDVDAVVAAVERAGLPRQVGERLHEGR